VLALALLAALAAGGNWFFHLRLSDRTSAADDSTATVSDYEAHVVCSGHVDVEFGVRALHPAQIGRVLEVLVHDGDQVEEHQPLLRLDEGSAKLLVREAEADVKAAQEQLKQAGLAPAQHRARLAQQRAAVEATERRLSAARSSLERLRNLAKAHQASEAEASAASDHVLELKAALRAEHEKLHELEIVDPQIAIRAAEESVAAKQARWEHTQRALDECTLRAPAAGEVLRVLNGPGDLLGLQRKEPAVLFAPRGRRFIRAEVTQEFADRVHIGLPAIIQDDARAIRTWNGHVQRVSDWYTQRRSVMHEPLQVNDVRTLECIVAVEPGQPPLRIGQRVRVILQQPTSSR
jgi:multidrug resistance efflux pump